MWCRLTPLLPSISRQPFRHLTRQCSGVANENHSKPKAAVQSSKLKQGPPLEHFIANSHPQSEANVEIEEPSVSYINKDELKGHGKKGNNKYFDILASFMIIVYKIV